MFWSRQLTDYSGDKWQWRDAMANQLTSHVHRNKATSWLVAK